MASTARPRRRGKDEAFSDRGGDAPERTTKTLAAARRVGRNHVFHPTTCDTYEVRGVTGRDEDRQEKTREAYKAVCV
jgi:hypothetical protein